MEFKLTVINDDMDQVQEFEYKRYPAALTGFNVIVSVLRNFSAHAYTVRLVDTTFDFVLNEERVVPID